MRIVVTGAAGTLGRSLLPRLAAAGHTVVAFDLVRGSGEADWVKGDVRDAEGVLAAVEGADVVVHSAALHGIHLAAHSLREFYDLNMTGTFNVWQAAVAHRIGGVVFSSTMGVYGESRQPSAGDDVTFLDEDVHLQPGDIYGWTKAAGEELCRYHLREHAIPSIALRYGMFVPEPFFRYGIRLLYGGVHVEDVVSSVMAAISAFGLRAVGFEVYNVESPLPFVAADARDLRADPLAAIERHWPGARDLLLARGVQSLQPITEVFPISRLQSGLGLRPTHDFSSWLADLAALPGERPTGDIPWP